MANFVLSPGQGSAWENRNKTQEKHPDYTATLKLAQDYKAGDELKFAIWSKQSTRGVWLSLKEDTGMRGQTGKPYEPQKTYRSKSNDDDIPF